MELNSCMVPDRYETNSVHINYALSESVSVSGPSSSF